MHLILLLFNFFQIIGTDSTAKNLDPLTVSATIINQDLSKTGRNVSIISQETIAASPVQTLEGVLKYALGVDVRSRSANGVQADISIRGGHYDQTLIVVDGIKVNDPQTGHHSLNFPISLINIERIEVLQGGAARVYGPNAFAGVINIITKKVSNSSLNADYSVGSFGTWSTDQVLNLKRHNNFIRLSGSLASSDGYINNTNFDKNQYQVLAGKYFKNSEISLSHSMFKNIFGASNFYQPKFFNQAESVKSTLTYLKYQQNLSKRMSGIFIASKRTHYDLYDFDEFRKKNRLSSVNFHKTEVLDMEYKLKINSKLGKTALGLEWRSEAVISNRLGTKLPKDIPVNDYKTVNYSLGTVRENWSIFTEHSYTKNKFTVNLGSMINQNSSFGTTWYPGIDLNYNVNTEQSVYLSTNRSLRYPTFTELYLNTTTLKADPLLKPEKAWTYEVGYKILKPKHSLLFSTFYRSTKDAIDKISKPNIAIPFMVNIDDINVLGLEAQDKIQINKKIKGFTLKTLELGYAFLQADKKEVGFQSFYLLNFLRHKSTFGLDASILETLNLNIWYTAKDRLGEFQLDKISPLLAYKPVYLLDIRLSLPKKYFSVYLDANNLLDYKYEEFGFVKQPGRWINTGVKINL